MRWLLGAVLAAALGVAPSAGAKVTEGQPLLEGPDVSVTVTAPARVQHGKLVTYMITVSNAGPDTATDVVVTDQFWKRAHLLSISRSQGSYGIEFFEEGPTITWELDELGVGSRATLFLIARPASRGRLANTVAVTAPGDPDGTGNTAELATAVT